MQRKRSDAMEAVVQSLCANIDTPRALAAWLCFKHNQDALVELPMPAIADSDTAKFQLDYFITEYLSKYKGLKLSVDPKQVAIQKWRTSEQKCRETNFRFRTQSFEVNPRAEGILFDAQRKIATVLGTLQLPVVLSDCKWGPGATYDMKRMDATPDKKISQPISVTAQALPYMKAVVESDPHWAACFLPVFPEAAFSLLPETCFKLVRGSRLITVPKSAKTDRVIAAEPTGNSFLQQGVHSYMRRRLKRFGIDLDDQSINQYRAAIAAECGLSTLDLSAASDSIARELVWSLLPLDWALFLDSLRSHETLVEKGEWVRTEKFVSMGNAFCFELETLIFWALASAVADRFNGSVAQVSVYGDDLIVDRRTYDEVVAILSRTGFEVNEKKSYKDGYFFESCGKHYHRSVEVTPCYQKEVLSHPSEIIRAHNRLSRLASRVPGGEKLVAEALRLLSQQWPWKRSFPKVPYGYQGDEGFLRPLSEFRTDEHGGIVTYMYVFKPRYSEARENALYAYKLRRRQSRNPDELKGRCGVSREGRYVLKRKYVHETSYLEGGGSNNPSPEKLLGLSS